MSANQQSESHASDDAHAPLHPQPPALVRPAVWPRLLTYGTVLAALSAVALGARPLVLAALLLSVCIWIAIGMMSPRSGIFARPALGCAPGRGRIALTFDDGPDPAVTPRLLELLAAHGQRATFFLIGRRAQAHPDLVRAIVARGHAIGNHSYTHAWSTPLWTTGRLAADLARCQEVLMRAAGVRPRWFRPPVGLFGPRVESAARRVSLALCGWTLRSNDGALFGYDATRVRARVLARLRDGDVILLHDGAERSHRRPRAPEVLPALLELLAARGLRSVTLDELLAPELESES
ncbi:MAG TPA: polysaccharide deacetylase family protein [Polyangia bacterium]|nr:polysaccharide deacetylase family protein [Polyangia bacterium]